jgi:hypothetical protein
MRKSPEGSPRRCSGAAWPASGGLSRATINAWNQHGVPRRPRSPYRLGGDGGGGRAASQQALEVGAPRPAVGPSRCRQLCPTGCLAQHPSQHEQLACRHQLLNLAAAGVGLAAVLVAGVGCGSQDGQQVGEPSDRLTGQPYVHPVSPATVGRDARGQVHPAGDQPSSRYWSATASWLMHAGRGAHQHGPWACEGLCHTSRPQRARGHHRSAVPRRSGVPCAAARSSCR